MGYLQAWFSCWTDVCDHLDSREMTATQMIGLHLLSSTPLPRCILCSISRDNSFDASHRPESNRPRHTDRPAQRLNYSASSIYPEMKCILSTPCISFPLLITSRLHQWTPHVSGSSSGPGPSPTWTCTLVTVVAGPGFSSNLLHECGAKSWR